MVLPVKENAGWGGIRSSQMVIDLFPENLTTDLAWLPHSWGLVSMGLSFGTELETYGNAAHSISTSVVKRSGWTATQM